MVLKWGLRASLSMSRPGFESGQRQLLLNNFQLTVCSKNENKKRPGMVRSSGAKGSNVSI